GPVEAFVAAHFFCADAGVPHPLRAAGHRAAQADLDRVPRQSRPQCRDLGGAGGRHSAVIPPMLRLYPEVAWVNSFRIADPGLAVDRPPVLLAPMAAILG